MKKFRTYLVIVLTIISSLILIKTLRLHRITMKLAQKAYEKTFYSYNINHHLSLRYPVTEHKPIVVVITSYKTEEYCQDNIQSVLKQTYDNFRVIYIDDHSPDNTFDIVQEMVKKSGKEKLFTLIRNPARKMKFTNLYKAFHSCRDEEIICVLDGDDTFPDKNVLDRINRYYQNPDVWLTYGSTVTQPDYKKWGKNYPDHIFLKQKIRDLNEFCLNPLRTFYAGLFKQIRLKDLYYKGQFLAAADDPAYMYPMVEMGPTHCLFVNDVLYIANLDNPISDHNYRFTLQQALHQYIQKRPKYKVLPASFDPRKTNAPSSASIDLFVCSEDNPLRLASSLESYQQSLTSLHQITVLYRASKEESQQAYQQLAARFPTVTFIEEQTSPLQALSKHLAKSQSTSAHIALASDSFLLQKPVDLHDCVLKMDQTGARNFLLGHFGTSVPTNEVTNAFRALTSFDIAKHPQFKQDTFFIVMSQEDALMTLKKAEVAKKGFLETNLFSLLSEEEISLFDEESRLLSMK